MAVPFWLETNLTQVREKKKRQSQFNSFSAIINQSYIAALSAAPGKSKQPIHQGRPLSPYKSLLKS